MNTKLKMKKEKILQRKTQKSHISPFIYHSSNGITLVALIVTVIVLAILATVSIQAINGEGIIGRAQEAAFKAEMANLQEDLGLFVSEFIYFKCKY